MSFIWPGMLFLLLVVPLCILLYLRLVRWRRQLAASYGVFGMTGEAGGQRSGGLRRHLPPALFLLSVTILIVALARPQAVVSLPTQEGTVILAFDVSGSMAAEDMQPTRMEAAKAAAQEFVKRQPPSVQVGVVAFSDSGFTVQPPGNDQETILAAINRLVPQRGTSLAAGILTSLSLITGEEPQTFQPEAGQDPPPTSSPVPPGTQLPGIIILLTDGENTTNPDPLAAAQAAADRGVRIYTVGIGSPAGIVLHVNGFTVLTQLNEAMLQQISQITTGAYYSAENEEDLLAVYENIHPQFAIKAQKMEITSIFAGAGILVLLLGAALSLLWFSRLP